MDFLRAHQLNIMLFMSGICGVLAVLVLLTESVSRRRKGILASIEAAAMFLLLADRYAYIFRGDPSQLGYWMVRICNFLVFFLTLFISNGITLYMMDLYTNEGRMSKPPRPLQACRILFFVGAALLVVSQFTGLYYTFDDMNRYTRSGIFAISYFPPVLIILLQEGVVIRYRKVLRRSINISLLLNTFVPLAAAILQLFVYGISFMNMTINGMVIALYIFALLDLNEALREARRKELEAQEKDRRNQRLLFEQTAEALVSAIEAKDKYTHGHSARVARYSTLIAREVGKTEEECRTLYYVALLHDVGKIGISDEIINKVGKLTDEEFAMIKRHPVFGNNILSRIKQMPYLSIGAHYHHERYDGRGYPEGLKGEDIPEIARIIAVADAYDAMTSKRSYRNSVPQHVVREELVKGTGAQFDPIFAAAMIRLVDRDVACSMQDRYDGVDAPIENAKLDTREFRESSDGVLVNRTITRIQVTVRPRQGYSGGEALPTLILYDALDGRIHSDEASRRILLYYEYAKVRFDGLTVSAGARKAETRTVREESGAASVDGETRYEIETVRHKDHVMIRVSDGKTVRQTIVALPDGSRFAYTALEGEGCEMSPIRVVVEEEAVPEDYIPRIAEEISYIRNCPQGDVPNVQIDSWRSESTEGIPITDGMRLTFHTKSLPTARLVWHCPFISIYTSKDGRPGGAGYREFLLVRLDGENWESDDHVENNVHVEHTRAFESWNAWKERNKQGLDCAADIWRDGRHIRISTETIGISILADTNILDDVDELYVGLTGDQCAITNIRVQKL